MTVKDTDRLYKKASNGKIRTWQGHISYNAEDDEAFIYTTYGELNGSKHTTKLKKVYPKNIGKSNETTPLQQAQLEMDSMVSDKLVKDRYTTDPKGEVEQRIPSPMLAKEYNQYKDQIWERGQIVCTQPKLDGIRCIANENGMFTRQGKPITSCPHIMAELQEIFRIMPGVTLDGELYNHDLKDDFQKLVSIIRKQNQTPDTLKESEKYIQLHLYDRVSNNNFYSRWGNFVIGFQDLGLKYIKLVKTATPVNQTELDEFYKDYIEQGYEGMMVRWGNEPYKESRSKHLLKRKDFDSDEFEVDLLDEGQGDWEGAAKRFILKLGPKRFAAGVRGTRDELTALWTRERPPDWATVRYFGKSNDGVPRFPVVVDYGWDERDD